MQTMGLDFMSCTSLLPMSMLNQHTSQTHGNIPRGPAPLPLGIKSHSISPSYFNSFLYLLCPGTGDLPHGVPTISFRVWSLSLFLFCPLTSLHTSKHSLSPALSLAFQITNNLAESSVHKREEVARAKSKQNASPAHWVHGLCKRGRNLGSYGLCP